MTRQVPEQAAEAVRTTAPLDALIGREGAVARLTELMADHRLITLIGPGGAGKTRLAAELAVNCAHRVWWIDLSSLSGGEGLLAAVATACGGPTPSNDAAAVIGHLSRQQAV